MFRAAEGSGTLPSRNQRPTSTTASNFVARRSESDERKSRGHETRSFGAKSAPLRVYEKSTKDSRDVHQAASNEAEISWRCHNSHSEEVANRDFPPPGFRNSMTGQHLGRRQRDEASDDPPFPSCLSVLENASSPLPLGRLPWSAVLRRISRRGQDETHGSDERKIYLDSLRGCPGVTFHVNCGAPKAYLSRDRRKLERRLDSLAFFIRSGVARGRLPLRRDRKAIPSSLRE